MPLDYDVQATATAMRAEGLPEEFVESLETGIWTTCAAILPAAERQTGRQQSAQQATQLQQVGTYT